MKHYSFFNFFEPFKNVQSLSCVWLFETPWIDVRLPCPSPTPRIYSNSCSLSRWCHPTISSSVVPFSSCQSFPASGSFQMSQFFASGGQSIEVSTLASVLPMNIQDWFPLGLTGLILLFTVTEFTRVFSDLRGCKIPCLMGIPWRSSGEDSVLSLPWAWVQSPVGELKIPQAVRHGQ